MKNSSKQIDRKILKTLEPLNRLNPILLDELAAKSIVDEVPADQIICRHGENDSRQIYLLSGEIEVVIAGQTETKIIKSKSALTTPIAEGSPRAATLKSKTASTLLYIDADLLELLMSDEPGLNSSYLVNEITADDNDDWIHSFLQSVPFLQLSTKNIEKLLSYMVEIPVKKGQVVINQGDTDDNYYIVKSGSCSVHRQPYKGSANVLLVTLPTGSGFGEEALISNSTRNATITMRENGSLMRMKKKDFLSLLINPIMTYFEHDEIQQRTENGAVVIDVRTEMQRKEKPHTGSINIPLTMLRMKLASLRSADREYLLICNDGSQSAAAAFLMIQKGLKCLVLTGGLNNTKATAKPVTTAVNNNTAPNDKIKELAKQNIQVIEEEILVELVAEDKTTDISNKVDDNVNYKSISIPGMSEIDPIDKEQPIQKNVAIKEKLIQFEDLFEFNDPRVAQKMVAHRTQAENSLTQIATSAPESGVIQPVVEEEDTTYDNNIFLNQGAVPAPTALEMPQQFDKQAFMSKQQQSKSNTLAIAASFLMILAGAVFTLHATNTIKVQSIAALFNSGNDTIQSTTALVKRKTINKKVLRADTKVNVKKKVTNKIDDIMTGWKNILDESKNPKKIKK